MIERRILEQFQNPMFVGDMICPDEQTRIAEGQKVIGAGRIGPKAAMSCEMREFWSCCAWSAAAFLAVALNSCTCSLRAALA